MTIKAKFLESKGLDVRFFAPPAHSMDINTILALRKLNINLVSDGFSHHALDGIKWIPLKHGEKYIFWEVLIQFVNIQKKLMENINLNFMSLEIEKQQILMMKF